MATDTPGGTAVGGTEFGEVSRLKGTAFRYLALAASLLGIIALAVLLAFVFWDAFGLASAGIGWYGTFAGSLVLPLVAFVGYARSRPPVARGAFELVTTILGGLMLAVGLTLVLAVIAGAPLWFAYFLSVIAPAGAVVAYGRLDREATWTGVVALGTVVGGVVVGTLALPWLTIPGRLLGAPGVYFLSLVLPAALGLRVLLERRFEYDRRTARAAAVALPVVAIAAVPVVDTVPAISRSVWLILLTVFVAPSAVVVANTARDTDRRPALALLAIAAGGLLVGRLVVGIAGFSRPSPWLDWQYVTSDPSLTIPANAGLYPAIVGSVFIIVLVSIFTFVFGVGTAIYLEEYAPASGPMATVTEVIQVNITNLAGVPSVVYGLLGLGVFVNVEYALKAAGVTLFSYAGFGVGTALTASLTLSLLILPIVVVSAQEAIRSVPDSLRQASYGMGATRWQTIRNVVLPRSIPGILTGTILALGRAIGETAPLIIIGAATTTFNAPSGLFSKVSAMPMQIYAWAFQPQEAFRHGVVAAGVVTLLVTMLTMNSVAILVRNKYERES